MKGAQPVDLVGQGEGRAPQAKREPGDLGHPRFDHARLASQRYLSLAEAADYLRFPSPKAFHEWTRRQGLRACKAGRTNLYLRVDLERCVEQTRGNSSQESHAPKRKGLRLAIPLNPVTPK